MRILLIIPALLLFSSAYAQRNLSSLPDIPGYKTLKGDFHIHTIFSDGEVWPTFRVDEAAREGLDVIAITDHIEYLPYKKYLISDHNSSYEVASARAKERNILLIKGVEITRPMPTGHFNALFIKDTNKLTDSDFLKVMEEAVRQGAFIFWNHPGWKSQQPDGIPKFHDIHNELFKNGWLHGIEFYNTKCAYGFVLDWCNEKNLTVFANSDVHIAVSDYWEFSKGGTRPITLVFAKNRTEADVKDALQHGRTLALYSGDSIAGKKEWAEAFFKSSIKVNKPHYEDAGNIYLNIVNTSGLPYYLEDMNADSEVKRITLKANAATMMKVKKGAAPEFKFKVRNILIGNRKFHK